MKNMSKLLISIIFLSTIVSNSFAGAYGYVWILTDSGYYDEINYARDEYKYLLGYKEIMDRKPIPSINSIIQIEAKNRLFSDFNIIQTLSKEFFIKEECKKSHLGGGFSNMMLYPDEKCSVVNILENLKDSKDKFFKNIFYNELPCPIKARVLGYVRFDAGTFALIEQIKVMCEKDK
ncbi:hypothetical protein O8C79_07805 [Aliarcobacter butzleri]|uniref:Uncharacterized protein n=1 Tax=bioreactor metagenome TaxID=1076179 RepID=A0A644VN70_9ZZZZ|nr:hypothetical protein [Aliarcobacter butzleri]MDN5105192.1 hypothetical protein [Aliarcobacter butzleri]